MSTPINATLVFQRLQDLRDWAAHVHRSLTRDEAWEPGRTGLMEGMVTERALRAAREEAQALQLHLRELCRQAEGLAIVEELSKSAQAAGAQAVATAR